MMMMIFSFQNDLAFYQAAVRVAAAPESNGINPDPNRFCPYSADSTVIQLNCLAREYHFCVDIMYTLYCLWCRVWFSPFYVFPLKRLVVALLVFAIPETRVEPHVGLRIHSKQGHFIDTFVSSVFHVCRCGGTKGVDATLLPEEEGRVKRLMVVALLCYYVHPFKWWRSGLHSVVRG